MIAFPGAFEFDNGRAWKQSDFDVMEALFDIGLITYPRGKHQSVYLTEDGLARAKSFARTMLAQS